MADDDRIVDLGNSGGDARPPRGEKPPRTRTSRQGRSTNDNSAGKSKTRSPADRKLEQAVSGFYTTAGGILVGIGFRMDDPGLSGAGVQTINMADTTAAAWMDLADQNPKVKAALRRFTEVSAAGVLIGCHFAMLTPLLIHRGMVPAEFAAAMGGEAHTAETNGHGGASAN